jgi:hypothetical protein
MEWFFQMLRQRPYARAITMILLFKILALTLIKLTFFNDPDRPDAEAVDRAFISTSTRG